MVSEHAPRAEYVSSNDLMMQTWLVYGNWKDFPPSSDEKRHVNYRSGYLAISQGNPYHKLGKTSEAIGGDFRVYKKKMTEWSTLGAGPRHFSYSHDPLQDGMEHWYAQQTCVGPHISDSDSYWGNAIPSSFEHLDALGATAINRMRPNKPAFNSAAFAGEILSDGLPSFGFQTWKRRTELARSAGSDYLNSEFGWKPLVSDIRAFCHAVKNRDAILRRYIEDSGKLIHRRYDYPVDTDTSLVEYEGYFPVPRLIDALDLPNCTEALLLQRTTYTRKVWVEATFTYVLPPMGSRMRDIALADKLLGIRLTPEVVWELTPWSWAVDWFSNLGDVIANLQAFLLDGLVMPYAYVMEHVKVHRHYRLSGISYDTYPGPHTFYQDFFNEVKTRRVGNPFGFGLKDEDLSSRQKAILGALLASRGRGRGR